MTVGRTFKVGVAPCMMHQDPHRTLYNGRPLIFLEQSMGRWLSDYGFLTYMLIIPGANFDAAIDAALDDIDGLVIPGGVDVCPRSYGEEPMRDAWLGDAYRDRYEIELIKRAFDRDIPILGICRGHQIINVAFGGTLYQDISTQIETEFDHRRADIYEQNTHQIVFNPTSQLSAAYAGIREAKVNSVHHQAVKTIAPGFEVEARSANDGVIEAIRSTDPTRYVAGVQWHPEFQNPDDQTLLPTKPLLAQFERAMNRR